MNVAGCRKYIVIVFFIFLIPNVSFARVSKEIKGVVENVYQPAVFHLGLETAQEPLEPDLLKTFVVVEKNNLIPADRAFYMITPQNYEYRGAVVDGEVVKTRMGKPYMYLPKGTIMTVVDDIFSGRTVYLKLLSIQKMKSPMYPKKKPTRVSVMLGFKFDKTTAEFSDAGPVIARIKEWVKPFKTYSGAVKYSQGISVPVEEKPVLVEEAGKELKPRRRSLSPRAKDM